MRDPFDYRQAFEETSELTAALSLEHDVVLSREFVSEEQYRTAPTAFLRNVRKESVPV